MNIFANLWMYIVDLFNYFLKPPIAPVPTDNPEVNRLKSIFLKYNKPFKTVYPPLTGVTINAIIHAISDTTATELASAIVSNAPLVDDDANYFAACIFQESQGDPECYNHNLAEYNGVISFQGTDWGIAQNSGYYLPSKPGMEGLTEDQMSAKAMTIAWAVPEMASVMQSNLKQANNDLYAAQSELDELKKQIKDGTDINDINTKIAANLITIMKELNTTALSNEQWYATLGYNRGMKGALNLILTKNIAQMNHPYAVGKWYETFRNIK